MRFLAVCVCTVFLSIASVAFAAEVDCQYLKVTLPDDWMIVEQPSKDSDGMLTAAFGKKDKSVSVSLAGGPSEGKGAKELAEMLAPSIGAKEQPAEYKGQYGFPVSSSGVDGFCVVAAGKADFLLTCIHGDLGSASPVLDGMKSDAYPELVPQ